MLESSTKYIIGLPNTTNLKKDLIDKFQHTYQNYNFSLSALNNNLYGVTSRVQWNNERMLWAHIFVDQNKRLEEHNRLQNDILTMFDNAVKNPNDFKDNDDYLQFLTFRKSKNSVDEYIVKKNQDEF
jgi:hypothetical protein